MDIMNVPSKELFYNILATQGRDEFDKLANALAKNLNDARKQWEDEKKAEAEKQRLINERKQAENRAALAISGHLNDLFGDIWNREWCSDFAKDMIADLNRRAQAMDDIQKAAEKVADTLPVVEEKKTDKGTTIKKSGKVDLNSPEVTDLLKVFEEIFK